MENVNSEEKKKPNFNSSKKSQDKTCEIDDHIIEKYDLKKRLGKGAYGIVYKAVDRKTNETVAIKKIFDAFCNQTDAQRTYREIFFLRSFKKHPNIIKLINIHRALNNKDIYLVFDYMQTDLHNVIKCGNILKDIHKQYIMYQMLKATKYIHSGNVIHRDQKPSNVLIDNACRVKIADFGLARSVSTNDKFGVGNTDPCLTDYVATRWYRAPEILIASKSYTKGVDMWSLGCILGEMILGKPLFPGTSTVNQIEKIMSCLPLPSETDISAVCTGYGSALIRTAVKKRTSLRELLKDATDETLDLIAKLLVFNPMKRCSAIQALTHPYVIKFNQENNEPVLTKDVVPPLREDLRLSIDEYRDKIYGIKKKEVLRMKDVASSPYKNITSSSTSIESKYFKKNSNQKIDKSELMQKSSTKLHTEEKISNKNIDLFSKIYSTNFYAKEKEIKDVHNLNNKVQGKKRNPLFKNHSLEENRNNKDSYKTICKNEVVRSKTDDIKKNSRKAII